MLFHKDYGRDLRRGDAVELHGFAGEVGIGDLEQAIGACNVGGDGLPLGNRQRQVGGRPYAVRAAGRGRQIQRQAAGRDGGDAVGVGLQQDRQRRHAAGGAAVKVGNDDLIIARLIREAGAKNQR